MCALHRKDQKKCARRTKKTRKSVQGAQNFRKNGVHTFSKKNVRTGCNPRNARRWRTLRCSHIIHAGTAQNTLPRSARFFLSLSPPKEHSLVEPQTDQSHISFISKPEKVFCVNLNGRLLFSFFFFVFFGITATLRSRPSSSANLRALERHQLEHITARKSRGNADRQTFEWKFSFRA
jgi:hypothetical protein